MSDSHTGPRPIPSSIRTDDDTVSHLLRAAGTRPAVPADELAIAKAAARAQWRKTVRAQRQRRRFIRGGAGLLATAAVLALVLGTDLGRRLRSLAAGAGTDTVVAHIEARSVPPAVGAERAVGDSVVAGQWVETTPAGARVALRLVSGASVRLDVDTRLRLDAGERITLQRGAVYVDAGTGPGDSVVVHTALGIVRDIGTQFEVRLLGSDADRLRVRVREGEVELTRDGTSVSARAGDEVAVLADGALARGTVLTFGHAWSWFDDIRPPFDPEAHSVLAFLEWMAREKGWILRFAEPSLRDRLATIKPYGTLDGRRLETAAAAWLAGAGLRHRLDGGIFRVAAAAP